ncbi:MAG: pyridoxal phosphate-dependent aminotransferase [Shimia sp.]
MSFFSKALAQVKPSPTVSITARAGELRAEGRPIIALSAGEPDFDTPPRIKAAAERAMVEGRTKYTPPDGIPALKAAVAEKFKRENGLAYTTSEVTVANGGKQVLYNALLATLNPGDEVVIPAPYWVSYPDMVTMCCGKPVIAQASMQTGYKLTADQLDAAITPHTKWVILNNPSNPTGAVHTPEELAEFCAVLMRHPQVWVMSDDMYEHLLFDGAAFSTPAQIEPALKPRTLTVNGVSKAYAMTGWRIGFAGGPAELIAQMRKVQSQTTGNPCSISQWAAVEALAGDPDFLARNRALFQRRRDMVVEGLNACPGILCPTPQGAFYVYPSIAELIGKTTPGGTRIEDDATFAAALLEEADVAIVHGAAFGLSPAFRVSYASADDELKEAVSRIRRFCDGCT